MVVNVLKEHIKRSYPNNGLVVYLHINSLFFTCFMIPCNVQHYVISALEMLVVTAYNDFPALGDAKSSYAVVLFGNRRGCRFCLYLGNSFFRRFRSFLLNGLRFYFGFGDDIRCKTAVHKYH